MALPKPPPLAHPSRLTPSSARGRSNQPEAPDAPARLGMPRSLTKDYVRKAERFALELATTFKGRVAAVILDRTPPAPQAAQERSRDIRLLVILDDLTRPLHEQDIHGYLSTVRRLVKGIDPNLHVSTLKLSEHWELCRLAAPHHLETLRYGTALFDRGFFDPMRMLVTKGRIRPTLESEGVYSTRADATIKNANNHLLQATLNLYWAGMDAVHAALMSHGETPPEPEDAANRMQHVLVGRRLLEPEYPKIMHMLYELSRGIMHKNITSVSGQDYEHYYAQTEKLVRRMERLVLRR